MTEPKQAKEFDFVGNALEIMDAAQKKGIVLKAMGAIAFRLHCPDFLSLFGELEREISDMDFVSYRKFRAEVRTLVSEFGYAPDERFMAFSSAEARHIYHNERGICVDVFFDKLKMCHTIDFRDRLELDHPTITVSDLLLQKMQIVRLTEKDIKDTIVLLLQHNIGDTDQDTVNGQYLAGLLSQDWGFYYTFTTNLGKVKEYSVQCNALTDEYRRRLAAKIDEILRVVDEKPKSTRWKMRAKVGTKKKWYDDVE